MKVVRAALYLFSLVVCATLFSACPRGQGGPGAGAAGMGGMTGPPPVATIVEPVQQINFAPAIELVGEVRAAQRVVLTAEVGGRVLKIAHRVGESHPQSAGALVVIDPATYEANLNGAKANLTQAEERFRMVQSGPRDQEVEAQRALVQAADAQYEQALDNLERQRELYAHDVVPESAVVAAEKQAEALKGARDSQQQVLDRLLEGSRKEDIAAAKAGVDAARSAVEAAQLALSRTAISVPFDAEVSALLVEEGAFVGPGTPVVEVVSSSPGEAWFNLAENDYDSISPGATVQLSFDALPDVEIEGKVISIAPAADVESRQFPLRVSLNDPRPKAGMAAYGRLLTDKPRAVLAVKRDAIVMSNLGEAVYVMLPPGPDAKPPMEGMPPLPTANQVLVTSGETVGDLVVIEKGDLQLGMMVVTRGNEGLYQGANIIPTNLMNEQGGGPGGAPPEGAAPGAAPGAGGPPAGQPGGAPPETPPAEGEDNAAPPAAPAEPDGDSESTQTGQGH